MKRVLYLIVLSLIIGVNCVSPANAGFISDKKAQIQQNRLEKSYKNEIHDLFSKQSEYAKKYDIAALRSLYSQDFVDNDGYTKDVYFSLVEDTWKAYPDITYDTKIVDIALNGDYASVDTVETSIATVDDIDAALPGELFSVAKCRYHLQRFSNKWVITSEDIYDEFSTLKYGDARFVDMHLEAPKIVGAGQSYTSKVKVDLPADYMIVGSISSEKIVNPATRPESTLMRLNEEQSLARVITANTDNVNEYTMASVAIASAQVVPQSKMRVYMNGLAFLMSRVNVIPKNEFTYVDKKENKNIEETKGNI